MGVVVSECHTNAVEKIRVSLRRYHGDRSIDLRIYFHEDAIMWRPTKRGITLMVDQWPEVRNALGKLAQAMQEQS